MRRFVTVVVAAALAGCSTSLGRMGILVPDGEAVGLKLLRPGVSGRSCRASIVGVALGGGDPDLQEAVARVLALDPEGNALTNAHVRWEQIVTGVYNRRCLEVHGDLARTISTVAIPMPGHGTH